MPGFSQSCGLRQEFRQSQRLSLGQRQEQRLDQRQEQRQALLRLSNERFDEFVILVRNVWGHNLQPTARCANCDEGLNVTEIVLGFKFDVNDFTTQCPKCKSRFETTNIVDSRTGQEYAFWCGPQTLERLPGLEVLEVEEIRGQHPQIFYSAIFHYGSLLNAFGHRDIDYRRERFDWTAKARFCLGQIPDTDVAQLFGVQARKVMEMRREFNIPPYPHKRSIIPVNRQQELAKLRN